MAGIDSKRMAPAKNEKMDPESRKFYCEVLELLNRSEIPFLLGGAYAFSVYTGIERHTKDCDIFVLPEDSERILKVLADAGYETDVAWRHWLAKAFHGDDFIDVIFSSGNSVAEVDDLWFEHAVEGELLGFPVKLCPVEEIIWSKGFVMERERYDGADIAHLIRARAPYMDWQRLLRRFDGHWRVLFSHLVLFGFIYPCHRALIPDEVMQELLGRMQEELVTPPPQEQICQGTLISRAQYLMDITSWGYQDARLLPPVSMEREDVAQWTAAIEE